MHDCLPSCPGLLRAGMPRGVPSLRSPSSHLSGEAKGEDALDGEIQEEARAMPAGQIVDELPTVRVVHDPLEPGRRARSALLEDALEYPAAASWESRASNCNGPGGTRAAGRGAEQCTHRGSNFSNAISSSIATRRLLPACMLRECNWISLCCEIEAKASSRLAQLAELDAGVLEGRALVGERSAKYVRPRLRRSAGASSPRGCRRPRAGPRRCR